MPMSSRYVTPSHTIEYAAEHHAMIYVPKCENSDLHDQI